VNHEVLNQPPPLVDYNLFTTDRALRDAVAREGGGWACGALEESGGRLGAAEAIEWAAQANENPPVLHTHDRYGRRRDEIQFHPAWHNLMRLAVQYGIHNLPWAQPRPGVHVARAALAMLALENEAGHVCPISMTYSAVPVLRQLPALAAEWEPRIHSTRYDPSFRPASEKLGALVGMAMTEKQGGSDVRANITRAEPVGNGEYRIEGHKWFCSAPMNDAFLVLAQAPGGLSCFFLPRWTPEGRLNQIRLQRLKSKLGNRSNASSEVEFHGAWARLVGEEGRGVPAIIDMVQHTRLDCTLGSAALMRRALVEAVHHCRYRRAFGRLLIEQPLMRNVLADLAIESEAATVLALRVARAFDENDSAFARLAVAIAKYWTCKRTPAFVSEALECLGGNGYVEEFPMPRLYREAPLNSIWEGSGNVIVLDALRTVAKSPESFEGLRAEIRLAADPRLEKFVGPLPDNADEISGRRFVEKLALALQASLLRRYSPAAVADAFCASRLDCDAGYAFGTLPPGVDTGSILAGV
jgi:putative acyl-CoA dehydrogenase